MENACLHIKQRRTLGCLYYSKKPCTIISKVGAKSKIYLLNLNMKYTATKTMKCYEENPTLAMQFIIKDALPPPIFPRRDLSIAETLKSTSKKYNFIVVSHKVFSSFASIRAGHWRTTIKMNHLLRSSNMLIRVQLLDKREISNLATLLLIKPKVAARL